MPTALHPNDSAILRVAKQQPKLFNDYGYPDPTAVQTLASELGQGETDVYYALKHLKAIGAFSEYPHPSWKGIVSLTDLLNGKSDPIEIKAVRKTEVSKIADRAIASYVSPESEKLTPPAVLKAIRPLMDGISRLAPLVSYPEEQKLVKGANDLVEKLIRSREEFNQADMFAIETALFKDLYRIGKALENVFPEVPASSKRTFGLRVKTASQVQPEFIEWLWKDRIPLGKLSLFAGNPDVGKSLVSIDVTARLSSGRDFPDGSRNVNGPCDVLMLAAEDDPADTIVPRLIAAGADLNRVHFLTGTILGESDRGFALDADTKLLREHLFDHPEIRFVVVDPISNYLGSLKLNGEQDVRQALTPLVRIAQESGCAIVIVAHFNKQLGGDAIHKTGGAVGLVGIQRMAWAFAKSPDDPDQDLRVMARIKGNISPNTKGLKYKIASKEISIEGKPSLQPVIEWRGDTFETADNLLQTAADPDARSARQISAWLREFLNQGERPAHEIYDAAELKFGPCEDKLKRASKQLSVTKRQEDRRWFWSLQDTDLDNVLPF
jgi:hypothetical protein